MIFFALQRKVIEFSSLINHFGVAVPFEKKKVSEILLKSYLNKKIKKSDREKREKE